MSTRNHPMALSVSFLLVMFLGAVTSLAQANLVSPAAYLASQPKPNFAAGHHLPPLTRWGMDCGSNATIELANNWGYSVPVAFPYATPDYVTQITTPGTFDYAMAQLAKTNPGKYKFSVRIDRTFPDPPDGFWSTNAAGQFVDLTGTNFWPRNILTSGGYICGTNTGAPGFTFRPVVSPEGPDDYWRTATEYWMKSLRTIESNIHISIIVNGGEYGLQPQGWGWNAWMQDARVQARPVYYDPYARLTNGTWTIVNSNAMTWPRYVSDRKAHQLGFLTSAIKRTFPDRDLYIFYQTGVEQRRGYPSPPHYDDIFNQWGWMSDVMNTNTDLPSFEHYYANEASWTNEFNMLTCHLNAVGFNIKLGYKSNYNWVCGGYSTTDTNALSDISRYTGFLKCLYTSGMKGALPGYFALPPGNKGTLLGGLGFYASFPSDSPPHWLQQLIALSHVHALFSHLETFIDNSDLISGPQSHELSKDQPAYEFTNTVADAQARVLARKLRDVDQWLITAWASAGADRTVSVTIPDLGQVQVLARASGAVYRASRTNTTLFDRDGMHPTAVPLAPANVRRAE